MNGLKIKPMDFPDLKILIAIVRTGDTQEVKVAQKAIASVWQNFYIPHREEGRKAFEVFLDEIKTFDQIQDVDHQAYFISTLKWAFWAIGEEYFETWAAFILKCIQHPSGKIRQAIIHITDVLVLDLRDLPNSRRGQAEKRDAEGEVRELMSLQRFGSLVMSVEALLNRYDEPKYKQYKYVSSMPVGIYKSLQILLTEKLLPSEYYQHLYDEYLRNLKEVVATLLSPDSTYHRGKNGHANC